MLRVGLVTEMGARMHATIQLHNVQRRRVLIVPRFFLIFIR